MSSSTADSSIPTPPAITDGGRNEWRNLLPLLVTATLMAAACRGHFVKPHGDFYEFRETGRALLRGELPTTFKRAPVYPLLVVATGSLLHALVATETPADQIAAAWINAVLLPCNVLLCYAIGRRWFGECARWAALWIALLPIGLHCTAHTLVEPLLLVTILTTVMLAQRGSPWAFATAAVAAMTRYDATALVIGVAIAELLRTQHRRGVAIRTLLALLPLVGWMLLTALTWETRSQDHYLRQIAERPDVNLLWPMSITLRCAFDPGAIAIPVWAAEWGEWIGRAIPLGLMLTASVGAVVLLARRDAGAVVGVSFFLGYALVHAVFPFREGFMRFGYPPAPLLVLVSGMGLSWLTRWAGGFVRSRSVRTLLLAAIALPLVVLAVGELTRMQSSWQSTHGLAASLPVLALFGTGLTSLLAWHGRRGMGARCVLLLAFALLALSQMRAARPLLGSGRERINDVLAARWIRDNTSATDGVLTDSPGLLRLYCEDLPAKRFIGLGGIAANNWPEILDECRRRQVRFIIWHADVYSEQGAYYIRKWRLDRYKLLNNPDTAPGVTVVKRFADHPTLWIMRIDD